MEYKINDKIIFKTSIANKGYLIGKIKEIEDTQERGKVFITENYFYVLPQDVISKFTQENLDILKNNEKLNILNDNIFYIKNNIKELQIKLDEEIKKRTELLK